MKRSFCCHNIKTEATDRTHVLNTLTYRKSKSTSQPSTTPKHSVKTVYYEVSLSELLRLIDVSVLDDVLEGVFMSRCLTGFRSRDIDQKSFESELSTLKETSTKDTISVESHEKSVQWRQAAQACLNVQMEFPLPQREAFGFPNLINVTESGILKIITEYYVSLENSLIPSNLTGLVEGIMKLHVDDSTKMRSNLLRALQLLLLLVPLNSRKHLEQLLLFVDLIRDFGHTAVLRGCGTRFIVRRFMNVILPCEIKDKVGRRDSFSFLTYMWSLITIQLLLNYVCL